MAATQQAQSDAEITPFWRRIPKFFLYPFHVEPLAYSIGLAAFSLVAIILPTFLVELVILVAALRYAFRIMEQTSIGFLTPEQHQVDPKPERKNLPYKLIGIVLSWGLIVTLIAIINPRLGVVANICVTLAMPASVMALSMGNSYFKGMSPLQWLDVIRSVGKPYFALLAFLFLLTNGGPTLLGFLSPLLGGVMTLPIVNYVFIYFGFVMFNMMGYCLYQYHHMLGLAVKVEFDKAKDGSQPAAPQKSAKDLASELIAAKIAAGDTEGAIDAAYQQVRDMPEDVAVQERYYKLLLMAEKTDRALAHARGFISLLLRKERGEQACRVLKEARQLKPGFEPEDPLQLLKLARAGRRGGEHKMALDLLRELEKNYPRHPELPSALLLQAQVLSENFRKDDLARMVLDALIQKYPQHPAAEEARATLKVLEGMAALRIPASQKKSA